MVKNLNTSLKKEKRKIKLSTRLTIPILLVVMLQLVTFFAILVFGGEFRNIEQYTYNTLKEKTENRRNYIQNVLQEKPPVVEEYSERLNTVIADILAGNNATIADIKTDRSLNRDILEASVNVLSSLMRRAMVNDAFLILETGDLYADGGIGTAKAALYLRDLDPRSGSGYKDLLMELGFTSISQDLGITRDSGWSLYFTPDPDDEENYGFYYKTLQTAQDDPTLSLSQLGYWSGFSKPSFRAVPSMKYSLPLIAQDGTVYGVMGIGLTDSTILSNIPSNDFLSEGACYVLARSDSKDSYDIVTYSGSSFGRLVGSAKTLLISGVLEDGICDFDLPTDVLLAGSVQSIELYDQNSPYAQEQWALIAVADRMSVLRPMTVLVQMLLISALVSLVVAIVVAVLSCIGIIKPISEAIKLMNAKRNYNEVVRFRPSYIFEIDKMTDAITQLQVNVRDFASQVSQMIRIADMGLGTFMYDRLDDSVFVGQSLFKFLRGMELQEEDVMMDRQEFLSSIIVDELRDIVTKSLQQITSKAQEDYTNVFHIDQDDGTTIWMRLNMIHTPDSSVGILQDITDTMMEKKRIEYERDYDALTGLLNRHAYYQRVEELFHNKNKLKITAFVMIDLDNLKFVNDTYGHDFGDDYIKTAASILKRFQNYGGIVSRISGDEFNICLPGFSSKDEVRAVIADVREQLQQGSCLLADGAHFKIRASFGVSWYPDDADTYELLIKYADFAMYTIKHSTKGEVSEFDMSSYRTNSVLLTGVEEMNRVIEECSVKYAFQNIISAKTGEVYGYEALMRVQSQIFQSPLELMRTAKTGAKLYEIERLTWTKALADFKVQVDEGRIRKTDHLFINSIANAILEPADEDAIKKEYSYMLDQIVVEILESESANEEYTAHKLEIIKELGGQFALDDFGTGYNSEYALLTIHPNIIKIDRSIISGCDKDISRRMIISNLVKLTRPKQIRVLAEGVETEEELRTVIACGVDLLQGYYFSRPLFEPQPLAPEIVSLIQQLAKQSGSQKNTD